MTLKCTVTHSSWTCTLNTFLTNEVTQVMSCDSVATTKNPNSLLKRSNTISTPNFYMQYWECKLLYLYPWTYKVCIMRAWRCVSHGKVGKDMVISWGTGAVIKLEGASGPLASLGEAIECDALISCYNDICSQCNEHKMKFGVSNCWTGIWNGTMDWNMEWNSEHTQLQLTHVTGTAQSRLNYLVAVISTQKLYEQLRHCPPSCFHTLAWYCCWFSSDALLL